MFPAQAVSLALSVCDGAQLDPDWRKYAACRSGTGVDGDIFFLDWKESEAQAVCQDCPVRVSCLAFALGMSFNPPGVWGGLTRRERGKLLIAGGVHKICQECGSPIVKNGNTAVYCHVCRGAGSPVLARGQHGTG